MSASDILKLVQIDVEHDGLSYRAMSLRQLRDRDLPEAVILGGVKGALKIQVDVRAESLRTRISTPGSGQAMEYQEAQAQAAAALKTPNSANADKYPMLAASIGIDVDPTTGSPAVDVVAVARSIDAARTLWLTIGSAIRGARLAVKKAIDEASTVEDAVVAFDAANWPSIPPA